MKTLFFGLLLMISTAVTAQMSKADVKTGATGNYMNNSHIDADIWNVFQSRRSVRKFKPDAIPEKDIIKIIDAARMAPTSGNQQPWKFLVIRDRKTIDQIKEACIKMRLDKNASQNNSMENRELLAEKIKKTFEDYCSAPVYIVILTDNNSMYPGYNHWDGPLAAGYLMLAARALGYGTVFITDAIPEAVTKSVLNIPDNYTRVCITPLGLPYEWPAKPAKKNLEELIAWDKL